MQRVAGMNWVRRWVSATLLLIALAFLAAAYLAPLFGWDPIRGAIRAGFARYPAVVTAVGLGLIVSTFWLDWRDFKETGDRHFHHRLAFYGFILLLCGILTLTAVIVHGI
jgi:hypothetical protein